MRARWNAPVGGDHVVGLADRVGQPCSSSSCGSVIRAVAHSAALPARAARTAKLSTASSGVMPTTVMPLRGVTVHQSLVGQLEERLAHRGPAGAELPVISSRSRRVPGCIRPVRTRSRSSRAARERTVPPMV